MSSLKLTEVNKIYPSGSLALYDVSFEARDKEFLVILGGEKSGKSTLLRVIAGLEEPTNGLVELNGKDASDLDARDRDMAMVFKGDTLFRDRNVFENIAFGLRNRKVPQSVVEQRVKAAATILGLNDILQRRPKALTAVEKQRVAIGRALAREPGVYLFDEPLSGLDEKLKADMLNLVVNLQARVQGTFIYATKNLAEAMTIGTRIMVLKNGIIQQIDTPANLYDYPANAYVAFRIGSPTVNFLQNCKIIEEDGGYFADYGGGRLALSDKTVSRFESIKEYAESGKQVIVGIRPEDIAICGDGDIEGEVGKCEKQGEVTYAEFTLGGKTIIVTADGERAPGAAKAKICGERVLVFDSETRLTLLVRDEGYERTDYPDADVAPLSFAEEEEVLKKFKPKKEDKRNKLR